MNILIFGGLGKTAEPIIALLREEGHSITIYDIASSDTFIQSGNVKIINGDICDKEAVNKAMTDIDVVVHLAVNISDVHDDEKTFKTNVFVTYNILQSALNNNVSKVLVASSAPVHMLENTVEVNNIATDHICSAGEDFTYNLTKNIQEMIAEQFSRTYLMNCLVLRLGHIVDGKSKTDLSGNPLSELTYCKYGWVCRYDVARAFVKSIKADFAGYHVVNIIGDYRSGELFKMSTTKDLLGFECAEYFLNIEEE